VAEVAAEHWQHTDGVMIGREAYHNPWILGRGPALVWRERTCPTRDGHSCRAIWQFMSKEMQEGVSLSQLTRHILGLYQGLPGARKWRQYISQNAHRKSVGLEVVQQAAEQVKHAMEAAAEAAALEQHARPE
jgi:tRNA-dihydrouridine synthase A